MNLNVNYKKSKLRMSASVLAVAATLGMLGDVMGMDQPKSESHYNLNECLALFANNKIENSPLSYLDRKDISNILSVNTVCKSSTNIMLDNDKYFNGYINNFRKNTTRLLSLDGGGIRGIIEIYQLAVLEEITGKQCFELFDVFAGTSTGGIIAGALSFGLKAETILRLYMKCGPEIFKKGMNNHIDTKGLFGTQFYASFIESILHELTQLPDGGLCKFDNTKKGHLKKRVFLTGYDMSGKSGLLFDSEDRGVQGNNLASLLRVTSAAPTYFDPATCFYHGKKYTNCVDGGLFVNNPTSVVSDYLAMEDMRRIRQNERSAEHRKLDVYSFGTGNTSAIPCNIDFTNRSAIVTWTPSLLEALFNSSAITVDEAMVAKLEFSLYDSPQRLSVNKYYRNQPNLTDIRTHEMSNTDLLTTSLLLGEGSGQVYKGKITQLLTQLGFVGQNYVHDNVLEAEQNVKLELDVIDIKKGRDRLYFYGLINDFVLQDDDYLRSCYFYKLSFSNKPLFNGKSFELNNFNIDELKEIKSWIGLFIDYNKKHDQDKSIFSKTSGVIKLGASYIINVNKPRHQVITEVLSTILEAVNEKLLLSFDDFTLID